jgi:hypothetical protein
MKVRTDIRAGAFPTEVNDQFSQDEAEPDFDQAPSEFDPNEFFPW